MRSRAGESTRKARRPMSMHERITRAALPLVLATAAGALQLVLATLAGASLLILPAPAHAQSPNLGRPIAPGDIAAWDISIGPDGAGLPPGRGSVADGRALYVAKCQACHGE